MKRLASQRKILEAAGLTASQRRGVKVKTRWVKFRHVDQDIPVHTIVYPDGSHGPSLVEFTDGLIVWTEFRKHLMQSEGENESEAS